MCGLELSLDEVQDAGRGRRDSIDVDADSHCQRPAFQSSNAKSDAPYTETAKIKAATIARLRQHQRDTRYSTSSSISGIFTGARPDSCNWRFSSTRLICLKRFHAAIPARARGLASP